MAAVLAVYSGFDILQFIYSRSGRTWEMKMDKKEYAVELKHNGHNCAQAVLCAYAEEIGMSSRVMKKLGAGFGVGMGCMEADCGALCAAQMILGLKKYQDKPVLKDAAVLYRSFMDKCGAALCKDLKGRDTGTVLCECDDCVRNAVEVLEELL